VRHVSTAGALAARPGALLAKTSHCEVHLRAAT